MKISLNSTLAFIFILFSTGFLFLTDNKQAGIPYVREFFLIFIVLTTLLVIYLKNFKISRIELFVIGFIFFWMFYSAFMSWIDLEQPILYGLFEERRIINILLVIPFLFFFEKARLSLNKIEKYIVYSFLATISIGFLYYLQIITPRASVDFQVGGRVLEDIDGIYEGFRSGRFRIGETYILFTFFLTALHIRNLNFPKIDKKHFSWIFLGLVIISYVWLVIQTRVMMLKMLIGLILIFRKKIHKLVLILLGGIFGGLILLLITGTYQKQYLKVMELFEQSTGGDYDMNTRFNTINIIMNNIVEHPLGSGALSLQWNNGFHRLYNDHFYLSDVGFIGLLYRFGFISIPIVLVIYVICFKYALLNYKKNIPLLNSGIYVLLISLIFFPFSNILIFDGAVIAIFLALNLYVIRRKVIG